MHIQQLRQKFDELQLQPEWGKQRTIIESDNVKKIEEFIGNFIDFNNPNSREALIDCEGSLWTEFECGKKSVFLSACYKIKERLFSYYFNDDVISTIFDRFVCDGNKLTFSTELLFSLPLVSKRFEKFSLLIVQQLILKETPLNGKKIIPYPDKYEKPPPNQIKKRRIKLISAVINVLAKHKIKKIKLINFREFGNKHLKRLFEKCVDLESVKLKSLGTIKISEKVFFEILDKNPKLEIFHLKSDGEGLHNWFSFPFENKDYKLRELNVKTFSGDALVVVMNRCRNLESVKIGSGQLRGGNEFNRLEGKFDSLRQINFSCNFISNDAIGIILNKAPKLESLDVSNTFFNDQGFLNLLNTCTNLTSLNLSGCGISNLGIDAIADAFKAKKIACLNLKSLDLSGTGDLLGTRVSSAKFFSIVDKFPNLRSVIFFEKVTLNYGKESFPSITSYLKTDGANQDLDILTINSHKWIRHRRFT